MQARINHWLGTQHASTAQTGTTLCKGCARWLRTRISHPATILWSGSLDGFFLCCPMLHGDWAGLCPFVRRRLADKSNSICLRPPSFFLCSASLSLLFPSALSLLLNSSDPCFSLSKGILMHRCETFPCRSSNAPLKSSCSPIQNYQPYRFVESSHFSRIYAR